MPACVIGPLIALLLSWNLLNWVGMDIKRIREDRRPQPAGNARP